MSYAGFYINLDRCPERRAEIETQLARYGLNERYRRYPAAAGNTLGLPESRLNPGEMGCFISHYGVLKDNLGAAQHLHVIEDDTVFAPNTAAIIDRIIANGEIDSYDMLFTDIALPLTNDAFREFKLLYDKLVMRDGTGAIKGAAFQILRLSPHMASTTSSYIVNKNAIEKIHGFFHDEIGQDMRVPVDTLLFQKIREGAIKAGFIFPFITSARVEHTMTSTVRSSGGMATRFTAANLARYSFFIGAEMGECETLLRQLPQPPEADRHAQLLEKILAFSLTDGAAAEKPD